MARIVIVDDHVDSARALARLLESRRHVVTLFHTATDCLLGWEEASPQVMFLDIGLPGMNGWRLAESIRAALAGRPLKLIALTAHNEPEDRERSFQSGFDQHVGKPFNYEQVAALAIP